MFARSFTSMTDNIIKLFVRRETCRKHVRYLVLYLNMPELVLVYHILYMPTSPLADSAVTLYFKCASSSCTHRWDNFYYRLQAGERICIHSFSNWSASDRFIKNSTCIKIISVEFHSQHKCVIGQLKFISRVGILGLSSLGAQLLSKNASVLGFWNQMLRNEYQIQIIIKADWLLIAYFTLIRSLRNAYGQDALSNSEWVCGFNMTWCQNNSTSHICIMIIC